MPWADGRGFGSPRAGLVLAGLFFPELVGGAGFTFGADAPE
jgi:hypothetical protein